MQFISLSFLMLSMFLVSSCTPLPEYESSLPSTVKLMTLIDTDITILDSGVESILAVKEGCLSLMGMPIIISSKYEVREKDHAYYLFKDQQAVARIGSRVLFGGYFSNEINEYLSASSPVCLSDEYFIASEVIRL